MSAPCDLCLVLALLLCLSAGMEIRDDGLLDLKKELADQVKYQVQSVEGLQ